MANLLTVNQISTLINSLFAQASGGAITNVNTKDFVIVANTANKIGYEPILNAITQMISNTIFSARSYTGKFKGLMQDKYTFGNYIRKLQVSDGTFEDDPSWTLQDGKPVDQWNFKKAPVLETHFYGSDADMLQPPSILKNQLDLAFSRPDEVSRFWSMIATNTKNMLEVKTESLARATLANMIAAIVAAGDDSRHVHLITEYNAATGATLTTDNYQDPGNYGPFMQWVAGKVQTVCEMMTDRTDMFQTKITGHNIMHHTPFSRMKAYFSTEPVIQTQTRVLTELFNTQYMRGIDFERVNFWQTPKAPLSINATPIYLQADGTLKQETTPVELSNIYGIVFDEAACGINIYNEWSSATPINAKGGYSNMFYHYRKQYFNDFTEKCVLFTLD